MKIRINGMDAGIQLETEKTVGEILAALENWLAGTGHRLSGLSINDEVIGAGSLDLYFDKDIDTIETLDLMTSSLPELIAESLFRLMEDIDTYEAADFGEKGPFAERWKESPEARLLAEQSPVLFDWVQKTFSGEGLGPQGLRLLAEERLRELQDPAGEMDRAKALVTGVCTRLEELPLDIQTGKDSKAVETMNIFSGIAEKIFRVFNVLKMEGFPVQDIMAGDMPVAAYITEFNNILQELLRAYEQHDTVLVGDLAEYEMAPRLNGLYTAICDAMARRVQ